MHPCPQRAFRDLTAPYRLQGSPSVHSASAPSPDLPNFGLTRCAVRPRTCTRTAYSDFARTPPDSGRRLLEGTPEVKLQRKNRRALALGALAVSGALALTACGSDDTGSGTGGSARQQPAPRNIKCDDAKGQLLADGSSAQKNAIDAWVKQFTAACNGVQINYKGGGSGAGVTAFTQGQVAFAGSDSALKPEEVTASKKVCTGGQGIDLPMVGGPIARRLQPPGCRQPRPGRPDPRQDLRRQDQELERPGDQEAEPRREAADTKIQAFHRSDDSGTTDNFTKYLKAAAAERLEVRGRQGLAGQGRPVRRPAPPVSPQQVKQTDGAIGYFELSYATRRHHHGRASTPAPPPRSRPPSRTPPRPSPPPRSSAPATTWRWS